MPVCLSVCLFVVALFMPLRVVDVFLSLLLPLLSLFSFSSFLSLFSFVLADVVGAGGLFLSRFFGALKFSVLFSRSLSPLFGRIGVSSRGCLVKKAPHSYPPPSTTTAATSTPSTPSPAHYPWAQVYPPPQLAQNGGAVPTARVYVYDDAVSPLFNVLLSYLSSEPTPHPYTQHSLPFSLPH